MPETLTLSNALLDEVETSAATILVRLSKAPIPENKDSILPEEIVEADFLGYMPQFPQWEPCEVPNGDYGEIASQEIKFTTDGWLEKQQIYFAYMTSQIGADDMVILGIFEFPEPIRISGDGQEISTGAWRITKLP